MSAARRSPPEQLNVLWVVDFEYSTRLHHGAVIRYVNYSREMLRRGHKVYAAVRFEAGVREESRAWFEQLKAERVITGFIELVYDPPKTLRRRLVSLAFHPGLRNVLLREERRRTAAILESEMERRNIDVIIFSNRPLLFLATTARGPQPRLLDLCDCFALYLYRSFTDLIHNRQYSRAFALLRPILESVMEERYYGRRSQLNLVVSPVDKRALDTITGVPARSKVLLNGVQFPPRDSPAAEKDPNRLIFTGNMNFGPNLDAANWFLDRVFHRILDQRPDTWLVIAGANPPQALRARARDRVTITGYVEDLNREIARSALYVAPLVSGGGFKNKVIEAIVNRTYVAGTSLAVEFLDPATRALILTADSDKALADAIVDYLRHPEAYRSRLDALYEEIQRTFTWSSRTDQLLDMIGGRLNATAR